MTMSPRISRTPACWTRRSSSHMRSRTSLGSPLPLITRSPARTPLRDRSLEPDRRRPGERRAEQLEAGEGRHQLHQRGRVDRLVGLPGEARPRRVDLLDPGDHRLARNPAARQRRLDAARQGQRIGRGAARDRAPGHGRLGGAALPRRRSAAAPRRSTRRAAGAVPARLRALRQTPSVAIAWRHDRTRIAARRRR